LLNKHIRIKFLTKLQSFLVGFLKLFYFMIEITFSQTYINTKKPQDSPINPKQIRRAMASTHGRLLGPRAVNGSLLDVSGFL
jgi:hypothetical protein